MSIADFWNSSTPQKRLALLNSAGYPSGKSYAYRAWSYIPSWVRVDVAYTAKRLGVV